MKIQSFFVHNSPTTVQINSRLAALYPSYIRPIIRTCDMCKFTFSKFLLHSFHGMQKKYDLFVSTNAKEILWHCYGQMSICLFHVNGQYNRK